MRTQKEIEADFDIQDDKAEEILREYSRLEGLITFFMDECPGCGCTMPFEFDEGRCMKCKCDPCAGIVDDMSEEEFEALVKDNTYHMNIPMLLRKEFETVPQLLERQIKMRYRRAIITYCEANGIEMPQM